MAHIASRALSPAGRSTVGPALFNRIATAFAVWRQRRSLASLPDHLRQDVGLTDADKHEFERNNPEDPEDSVNGQFQSSVGAIQGVHKRNRNHDVDRQADKKDDQ